MTNLSTILSLIKYKVSIAVTFTTITGYIVFTRSFDLYIIPLGLGVFLLASGSSALNEFQESEYDAKMPRTKNRPIPTGKLSPLNALIISLIFILSGLSVLYCFFNETTALLGIFNVLWYNLLYTNLKRITAFAVVPGSLVGAIPAFIGWTAAGGYVFNTTIVYIAFFMFIWQIPHFWLLMVKYGKEYEQAGFPTINQTMSPDNLRTIILVWIIATSISSVMVPLFLQNISLVFFIAIFILNISFVAIFIKLSFGKIAEINFKQSFISINIYMMVFMLMLIVFHLAV
ncbi:MAG TPA: protoheme IX farnesyltransferase [Paludibacter sp.]